MTEPPRVPPDRDPPGPEDETIIVPPTEETVVADEWEPESAVFVEETQSTPPRPRPPLLWPGLLALLLLVLGGLGAYFLLTRDDDDAAQTTTSAVSTAAQVTVPDVVGTTSSEATETLTGRGLDVNLVSVPSDRAPGTVVAQSPAAGDEVAEGSPVRLNVAEAAEEPATTTTGQTTTAQTTTSPPTTTAPQPAAVPDVVGDELADAARSFGDEGLRVAVVYVPSSEAAGRVVAQAQPAGTELASGNTVQLNVSTGAEPAAETTVPDVTGEERDDARERLDDAGFEVLAIEVPTASDDRAGDVLSQSPSGGAGIPRGSLVLLYVGA